MLHLGTVLEEYCCYEYDKHTLVVVYVRLSCYLS
jgi:hypothetical protein